MFPYAGEVFSLSSAILWALAIILFKKSTKNVHHLGLNFFKNGAVILIFYISAVISTGSFFPEISLHDFILIAISGILGMGISDSLFFKSVAILESNQIAIVLCSYGFFILILSYIILGETLTVLQFIGVVLIFIGIYFTLANKENYQYKNSTKNTEKKINGMIYGFLAMLAAALGVIVMKPLLNKYSFYWIINFRLFAGLLYLTFYLMFFKNKKEIIKSIFIDKSSFKYLIIATLIGTYFAMILWMLGIKYTKVSIASILNQMSNIFVFIFGIIFFAEKYDWKKAFSILIATLGTILITFGK